MDDWDFDDKDLRTLDASLARTHARVARIKRSGAMIEALGVAMLLATIFALAGAATLAILGANWAIANKAASTTTLILAGLAFLMGCGLALAKAIEAQVQDQIKRKAANEREANQANHYARGLQSAIDGRARERAALDEADRIGAACGKGQKPAMAAAKRI